MGSTKVTAPKNRGQKSAGSLAIAFLLFFFRWLGRPSLVVPRETTSGKKIINCVRGTAVQVVPRSMPIFVSVRAATTGISTYNLLFLLDSLVNIRQR